MIRVIFFWSLWCLFSISIFYLLKQGIVHKCHTVSSSRMTCKTPDISACSFRNDMNILLSIHMDGTDVLKLQPRLRNMTVYPDPNFAGASIHEHQNTLILHVCFHLLLKFNKMLFNIVLFFYSLSR